MVIIISGYYSSNCLRRTDDDYYLRRLRDVMIILRDVHSTHTNSFHGPTLPARPTLDQSALDDTTIFKEYYNGLAP
jgi:hypothetical protein